MRFAWSEARGLRVVDVPRGGAAAGGLLPGDRVIGIDDERVEGMEYEAVVERLRGPVGTFVMLDVRRGEGTERVRIERVPYAERLRRQPSGYAVGEPSPTELARLRAAGIEPPAPAPSAADAGPRN